MAYEHNIPPKPVPLTVLPDQIPAELKALDQWVVWRYFWLADRQKWDKPPLQSHGGNLASTTNSKTWSTFDAAMHTYASGLFDGVGVVLTKQNRLVGIDLDHCRNAETGVIEPWVQDIIDDFATYTEVSPSGTGLHLIAAGNLSGKGVKTPRGELYDTGRYLTITGQRLADASPGIRPRHEAILGLYEARRIQPAGAKTAAEPSSNGVGPSPSADDTLILEKALGARNGTKVAALWSGDINGYPSHSEADLALCRELAFWTQDREQIDRLLRRSGLMREKWERADYRNGTITKAIESAHEHWQGVSAGHDYASDDERHTSQLCDDRGLILLPLRPYTAYRGPRTGVRHG
jgi:putative DNA primase/helicase